MRSKLRHSVVILGLLVALSATVAACGDSATEAAPDFSMVDALGDSVELADYRGTPVLLFFHMADG